jgi:hypothetical protein
MKRIAFLLVIFLTACSNKNLEKITIKDLPQEKPDLALVEKIEEKPLVEKKKDTGPKIKIKEKLPELDLEEPEDFPLSDTGSNKQEKVFIAIVLDEKDKNDAILEGAHLAINELYKEKNLALEITRLDLSSKLEDRELNLKELEKKNYQLIITSLPEEDLSFIKTFINNIKTINLEDCKIGLEDQIKTVEEKISNFYLLLPEDHYLSKTTNKEILLYSKKNSKIDLKQIAHAIDDDRPILFTEVNWKLQHFMAELEALDKKNPIIIVNSGPLLREVDLVSRFGKINRVTNEVNLDSFIKNYFNSFKKKPELTAWISYDLVKNFDQDKSSCKPKLLLVGYGQNQTKNFN